MTDFQDFQHFADQVGLSDWSPAPKDERLARAKDGSITIPQGVEGVEVVALAEAPDPLPISYLVEGLIPEGHASLLFGAGGVAKSLLAMSLCVAVTHGQASWLGRATQEGAALYVDFELDQSVQMRRAQMICRGEGRSGLPPELYYMSALGKTGDSAFWSAFKAMDENGIRLIVIDSFGLAMQDRGQPENATDVLAFFRSRIEPFLAERCAVLLIDHQAKGGDGPYQSRSAFGSTYKRNLVRSEMQLEGVDQDEHAGTISVMARHTKHNFGPFLRPFGIEVAFRGDEITVGQKQMSPLQMAQENAISATDRVLFALEGLEKGSYMDVADATTLSRPTVRKILQSLELKGKIRLVVGLRSNVPVYEMAATGLSGPQVVSYDQSF